MLALVQPAALGYNAMHMVQRATVNMAETGARALHIRITPLHTRGSCERHAIKKNHDRIAC